MNLSHRVLIVDDDRDICLMLSRLMKGEGLTSHIAHDGESALKMVRSQRPDALLLDLKMPGMDGMEVLRRVKELDTDLPVVLITAHADIAGSVAAIKAGAFDYLPKPFEHPEVARVVRRALAQRAEGQVGVGSPRSAPEAGLREMMGPSDAVSRLIQEVKQVTASDFSVVIQGETGAGKDLVARAIHLLSRRAAKEFVPVDCGAIPETLLESELFGYQKGAFTGAVLAKPGKFLAAQGGTLFLDEISNLALGSQAKLLRTLQDRVIYPLGTNKATPTDVRVLAASNQDLQTLVEAGLMRRDLYFRLNEFTINIPPLRERKEDIPYLAKRFLDITNRELGKERPELFRILPGSHVRLQLARQRAPAQVRHPPGGPPGRRPGHRKTSGPQAGFGAGPGLHSQSPGNPLAGPASEGDCAAQRLHGGKGGPGPGPEVHRGQQGQGGPAAPDRLQDHAHQGEVVRHQPTGRAI
jgi:DNA-binding NtrC family response regulator